MAHIYAHGMGRPRINGTEGEKMTARFADGTMARIDKARRPGEPLSAFLRKAVEHELERREDEAEA